jgi:hypothetical protein
MITIEISDKSDPNWNKRLLNTDLGTIYQTPEYASYTNSVLGWSTNYLKFIDERGEIVGQLMVSVYSRLDKKGNIGKFLKIIPIKKTIYRWICGPVVFDMRYGDQIRKLLHDFLISKNCIVIGSEHPLSNGCISNSKNNFKINTWGTFLIDLSLGEDTLWEKIDKHSAKKNVERSKNRGVLVSEMQRSDVILYHTMLQETKQNKESSVSLFAVEELWDKLRPLGFTGFLAYKDNSPIGGILVSSFNKYVNEWGVARSEIDRSSKFYAQDYLKWEIIRWGIRNNYRYYDLSGVNPNHQDAKEAGIFQYKKKWGGQFIEYKTYSI